MYSNRSSNPYTSKTRSPAPYTLRLSQPTAARGKDFFSGYLFVLAKGLSEVLVTCRPTYLRYCWPKTFFGMAFGSNFYLFLCRMKNRGPSSALAFTADLLFGAIIHSIRTSASCITLLRKTLYWSLKYYKVYQTQFYTTRKGSTFFYYVGQIFRFLNPLPPP